MRKTLCLITLTLLVVTTGCHTNPATGRSQLLGLSRDREIALGQEAAPQFLGQNGGEIPSDEILNYVRGIGRQLASSVEPEFRDLPWEFHVLDSAQINAFALPGGKVFFSRGLMEQMSNEAQLAAVLGHEVGHVTARHISEKMGQTMAVQIGEAAIGIGGAVSDEDWLKVLGVGAQAGGGLYLLKFGRDQESEADALGTRYMAANGWNPVGMLQVMEILAKASKGRSGWEILETHPRPETRFGRVEQIIKQDYPNYKDPAAYRFNQDRFQNIVVANLKRLKPPKHGRRQADAAMQLPANAIVCNCFEKGIASLTESTLNHTTSHTPTNPRLAAAFAQMKRIGASN